MNDETINGDPAMVGQVPVGPAYEFGQRLVCCDNAAMLRDGVDKLWGLLDDIDTASDMFKPHDEASYRRFYDFAMARAARRCEVCESNGYVLFFAKSFDTTPTPEKGT